MVTPTVLQVWDLPTRVFHWLLVATVTIAMLTGFLLPEWWMGIHLYAGYALAALLTFRLAWGLYGGEYARFANVMRATRYCVSYLRQLVQLRPPHYVGHNPAGALMILAFLLVLAGLVATGLIVEGGEEKQGPLAGLLSYAFGHRAKPVHEWLAYALLAMVLVHIAGVAVESWLQGVNLTKGMMTGAMPVPAGLNVPTPRPARPFAAMAALGVVGMGIGLAAVSLTGLPSYGLPVVPVNAGYRSECGGCHWAYHPSLLPRASWRAVMASLDEHFGEDASLTEPVAAGIAAYLDSFAAETFDSEAANRLRVIAAGEPKRITKTPFWTARHRDIAAATFASPAVRSAGNCIACHLDADSGRFDDQAIQIPKGALP